MGPISQISLTSLSFSFIFRENSPIADEPSPRFISPSRRRLASPLASRRRPAEAMAFAAPAALQSHWRADLRDGPWLQPELAPPGPLPDPHRRRRGARVPAGAGGNQFDTADPVEQRQETSFFNWYTFAVSSGGFIDLVLVVWVENQRGWDIGFTLRALCVLLGMLIWMAGFPFYRNQLPGGSAITRISCRYPPRVCLFRFKTTICSSSTDGNSTKYLASNRFLLWHSRKKCSVA